MRPIHLVDVDKRRPALLLTRETVRPHIANVVVAIITTTVRGLAIEVPVGPHNGLEQDSVVNCDNVQLVSLDDVGVRIGHLLPEQEPALAEAIRTAFDLA